MRQIEIDDEVFEYLKSKSTWNDRNPNDVLRKLLHINTKTEKISTDKTIRRVVVNKNPRADLKKLIQCGMVNDGQKLEFRHQDILPKKYEARVSSGKLYWEGSTYSMSKLVAVILRAERKDIPSEAYRGPAYWYNAEGRSIKDLWDQYLSE